SVGHRRYATTAAANANPPPRTHHGSDPSAASTQWTVWKYRPNLAWICVSMSSSKYLSTYGSTTARPPSTQARVVFATRIVSGTSASTRPPCVSSTRARLIGPSAEATTSKGTSTSSGSTDTSRRGG